MSFSLGSLMLLLSIIDDGSIESIRFLEFAIVSPLYVMIMDKSNWINQSCTSIIPTLSWGKMNKCEMKEVKFLDEPSRADLLDFVES